MEVVISYAIHTQCVKKILNSWATQSRIVPTDWKVLETAILKVGPLLQKWTCWQEVDSRIEKWNRARGTNISKDKFLGEGQ